MTMKLTITKFVSLGILLGLSVVPARADWLNYVVRTSGLAWSDGYHAYDQCPPKKHCHQHAFTLPGYGKSYASPQHEPYYFELNNNQPAEMLPQSPAEAAPAKSTLPNPQAQYKPQSRYFQAIEQNAQSQQLQARQPGPARPY
jgi:hypothetical protein